MPQPAALKPTHAAIRHYYEALRAYAEQHVDHEGAVETAFSRLLADTGRLHGWTLIPKQSVKVKGKTIIPDGTLKDEYFVPGHWEVKDTRDDLDAEIRKKIAKSYPLTNTIFEVTRAAVLYQNGRETNRFDIRQTQQLADLLNAFYAHTEPEHEDFDKAVDDFKERVPELAKNLAAKIKEAHDKNPPFQKAFATFFDLCQTALNPNIGRDAVDEMLVQDLLTERLFRNSFHDEEFTRRNVIAAEVEKVIAALVSKSYSRDEFLHSLVRSTDATVDSTDPPHFLNKVYERFLQGYSVILADTNGIVYTLQLISRSNQPVPFTVIPFAAWQTSTHTLRQELAGNIIELEIGAIL